MRSLSVADARVTYEVNGQGPALVLVHGTGGDAQSNWAALMPHLTEHWTVVRPNYAGAGDTLDDGHPLTIEALAEQVLAVARAAGAVPFDLVGFSLGAAVATHLAATYPDEVRSLVLLGGFLHARDSRLQLTFTLWRDLIRTDRRALTRLFMLTGFSSRFLNTLNAAQIDELVTLGVMHNRWDGIERQVALDLSLDVSAQAAAVRCPTLVIGCTYDEMVPPHHTRALADVIPGARYATLDSGHLAPLECPAELAQHILAHSLPA